MPKSKLDAFMEDLPDFPGTRKPINRPGGAPPPAKATNGWDARSRMFLIGEKEIELFEVGALALALERKPVTIRSWEARGIIPLANYRTPVPRRETVPGKAVKGRRLYTRAQIEFLIVAVRTHQLGDVKKADWPGFIQHIKTNWPK